MYAVQPKLSEKPLIAAFDKLTTEETNTIVLFALAYSNRMLFKAAVHIKRDLQLTTSLNTLTVRYLLLLYFTTLSRAKRGTIAFRVLERSDYFKVDKKRLNSMLILSHTGLAIASLTKTGKHTFEITDKGILAVSITTQFIKETIYSFPKAQLTCMPKRIQNTDLMPLHNS